MSLNGSFGTDPATMSLERRAKEMYLTLLLRRCTLDVETLPVATPSCDTSPKVSETTNLLDGGSIDLTSSGLESISYVGRSSVDARSNTESGDPLSAAPSGCTCSKLGETAKLEVNTFACETGNFELAGRGLESISCLGNDDPRRAALLSYRLLWPLTPCDVVAGAQGRP